jgi:2-polyprenyl-3-methyl-5-hydroxy-6-metoxy-1,4-benzoquinol methylase
MVATPYDKIADHFDHVRTKLNPKEAQYLALVLEPLRQGSTILDLGCGTGCPIAMHIASRGHRVLGVDGSEAMLAIARKALPEHRWIHDLIERVEFNEAFDAVVCWDSLFHLPRRFHEPIIRKIHCWLAPGGGFMVNSGGLVNDDDSGFTDTMFGHEFFYDSLPPGRMVRTTNETGFEIILAEMAEAPTGGRNKGKWAIVARKRP